MEWVILGVAWSVAVFAGGAVYGSTHSLYVGEKTYEVLELWEKVVDKFSRFERSTRKKIARAKRLGQEIDDKYL